MHDEVFSDEFFASMDGSILDVNSARMLPPKCYSDPRFFEFEKDAVFGHDWLCVGREAWNRSSPFLTPGSRFNPIDRILRMICCGDSSKAK